MGFGPWGVRRGTVTAGIPLAPGPAAIAPPARSGGLGVGPAPVVATTPHMARRFRVQRLGPGPGLRPEGSSSCYAVILGRLVSFPLWFIHCSPRARAHWPQRDSSSVPLCLPASSIRSWADTHFDTASAKAHWAPPSAQVSAGLRNDGSAWATLGGRHRGGIMSGCQYTMPARSAAVGASADKKAEVMSLTIVRICRTTAMRKRSASVDCLSRSCRAWSRAQNIRWRKAKDLQHLSSGRSAPRSSCKRVGAPLGPTTARGVTIPLQ